MADQDQEEELLKEITVGPRNMNISSCFGGHPYILIFLK